MWKKSVDRHYADVRYAQVGLTRRREGGYFFSGPARGQSSHMTHRRVDGGVHHYLKRLTGILGLAEEGTSVWVEPGVTMHQLVRWSMRRGFIPEVVPEFKAISVGGAIMGAALESSSFRYGQVNDTCDEYELMLGDGSIERVSREVNPELFYGVSGSYGSLASLTLAKVRLRPVQPWVHLEYDFVDDPRQTVELITQIADSENPPDFLEGVVLNPMATLVISGRFVDTDDVPAGANHLSFRWPWSRWYIHHLVQKGIEGERGVGIAPDYLPLYDYLFRFDRGAFWMGQFATGWRNLLHYLLKWQLPGRLVPKSLRERFERTPPSLNPSALSRWLLGWRYSSSQLYKVLHSLPRKAFENAFLVQDFYLPRQSTAHFLDYLAQEVQIYPLWLCPVRGSSAPQFLAPHYLINSSAYPKPDFINVGVYGIPVESNSIPHVTKRLEELCRGLGGRKMLYSLSYYDEEEFWSIYDRDRYTKLRQVCGAKEHYQGLYRKKRPR